MRQLLSGGWYRPAIYSLGAVIALVRADRVA